MVLREIKFKNDPLCNCSKCFGMGIVKHHNISSDIGIICSHCRGTGYEMVCLDDNHKLYIDEVHNTIYGVSHGVVNSIYELFNGIKDGSFKYAMYEDIYNYNISRHPYTINDFYELGVTSDYIIPFDEFKNGRMPLSKLYGEIKKEIFNAKANEYNITNNKIVLKELKINDRIKCHCNVCNGKGVVTYPYVNAHLGVICRLCNGSGFNYLDLGENETLVLDIATGSNYKLTNGIIDCIVYLFKGYIKDDEINYVMYHNSISSSYSEKLKDIKDYYAFGVSRDEIISYKKFLDGRLPLPMEKYNCPYQITSGSFDDDCNSDFVHCLKYGTGECWDKFYGEARVAGEKQEVLRRIKHS